jgi:hypothetical protein
MVSVVHVHWLVRTLAQSMRRGIRQALAVAWIAWHY